MQARGALVRAYPLFVVFGTLGSMRVPVIGWMPLTSVELLLPLAVLAALLLVTAWERCYGKPVGAAADNINVVRALLLTCQSGSVWEVQEKSPTAFAPRDAPL